MQKFRGYVEGSEVKPLKWLMSIKSPTGRLARWALLLQPFNIQIEYKPGKTNVIADTLSRPPCQDAHEEKESCEICAFSIEIPRTSSKEIRESQLSDPELKVIIECLGKHEEDETYWSKRGYFINDGVLYCYNDDETEEPQLVVPKDEREEILKFYHSDNTADHYGVQRTTQKIAARYYWPGMRRDISKYVKECIECQRYKATNLKPAGFYQTVASNQRFEVIAIDLFGPLPITPNGFQWIFITEDIASMGTAVPIASCYSRKLRQNLNKRSIFTICNS